MGDRPRSPGVLPSRKQALAEERLSDTAEATRLDAATWMALIRG
jgi:hypothetical protein